MSRSKSETRTLPPGIFDFGMQPERTALSWRRTALALTVGSLVSFRILPPIFGVAALSIGFIGIALAAVILLLSSHRYRAIHRQLMLSETDHVVMPPPLLLIVTASTVFSLGVICLLILLLR